MLLGPKLVPILLAAASSMPAQPAKAELFGVLRDPDGLPIDAVAVELLQPATGAKLSTVTAASGEYQFVALPAGAWSITVVKPGFSTLRRAGIVLRGGDRVGLDLSLALGDLTQSVVVTADAPLLRAARGTASFVVEREKL